MTETPTIWSIVIEPDYQCEWFVGEVWVELAGHQWREDTVVDVDVPTLSVVLMNK